MTTSYFKNIHFFNDSEPVHTDCKCRKRLKKLMAGKFTLVNKSFYVRKVPILFNFSFISDFKYVLEMFDEIVKDGYIPSPHPLIVTRDSLFSREIYVEIINQKSDIKNTGKIKTFDKSEKFSLTYRFSNSSSIITIISLAKRILQMSLDIKVKILKNLLSNNRYVVKFYCPLCSDNNKSLISAMLV